MIIIEIAFAIWLGWSFLQITIASVKFIICIALMPFAFAMSLWDVYKGKYTLKDLWDDCMNPSEAESEEEADEDELPWWIYM